MEEQNKATEIPLSEEEKTFAEMNQKLGDIQLKREDLVKILIDAASTTKLNPQEDAPRVTEVKLALFNAADAILKSQESLHISKAKMSLARKQEATSDNVKQAVVEMLRNIELGKVGTAPVAVAAAADAVLQSTFDNALANDPAVAIKDDELVTDA